MFQLIVDGLNGFFVPIETAFEAFFGFRTSSPQGLAIIFSADILFMALTLRLSRNSEDA